MLKKPSDTDIADDGAQLTGPWRSPRQMLAEQVYDDHVSIHDDATAKRLGFRGGAIEGPTHFSHPAFEGEEVQAIMSRPPAVARETDVLMVKRDGAEVLQGTASIAGARGPTALERRLAQGLPPLQDPVILADVRIGMKTGRQRVRMDFDRTMGALYPSSLRRKLAVITEPSWLYDPGTARESRWGRAVVPFEMLSVLFQYSSRDDGFPMRGPAVGLFADQEIRLVEGPLLVAEDYELEREVVAMSASRRTESLWVRTSVMRPGTDRIVAVMLLNLASLKDSYAPYAADHAALYGREPPGG